MGTKILIIQVSINPYVVVIFYLPNISSIEINQPPSPNLCLVGSLISFCWQKQLPVGMATT